jgi:asparagine synthase (glutamine-hydrolysing)
MCGIFGYVGHLSKDVATNCLNELVHRGPDGFGLYSTQSVTLAHRRLSILDLSIAGKQPMSYAKERLHITFNGEIYNYIELREELSALGHIFKTETDTEVILAAFIQWGESCLQRFNGMWAFAIWDTLNKSLFFARDRLGKKPFFFSHLKNGEFAFASEMKALIPLLDNLTPNINLIKDHSRIFTYEASDECLINGIKRLPAGHYGWVRDKKIDLKRWWNTLDNLIEVPKSYADQVELFRETFLDACKLRMRSDVAIGTALSGGLDSSATISSMAYLAKNSTDFKMGKDWQHAFVASFPGTPIDEVNYATQVTNHIGIDANVIDINPTSVIDKIYKYFYAFEELYVTSPIPFMMTYGAIKSAGVSVTLDGHGADELFAGYSFDYIKALNDAGLNINKARDVVDTIYNSWPQNTTQFNKLPNKLKYIAQYHAKNLFSSLRKRDEISVDESHPRWKSLGALNQQLYRSTHHTVLPTLLRNYDRYSMANGVEIRMPFLDHRILSLAFSLPWTSKIRNGYSKSIIRDALSPYMPESIAYRKQKIGFNSPIVDWFKGPLRTFALDILGSQSFKDCQLINAKLVTKSVLKVIEDPSATFADGERAWILLSPYFWEQSMIKRQTI